MMLIHYETNYYNM
uniref:Uncharacterized protein n=1 Tax=Arundo donax TaxID=35708 RepID=A0A0A9AEM9_ARUDO